MNLTSASLYINRELSWLKFNDRVLEEAEYDGHPLLERLKFVSIFSSNLDEFFMIRVAGLKEQVAAGIQEVPADGLTAAQQLEEISRHVHEAVERQARILNEQLLPRLARKGLRLRKIRSLGKDQKSFLETYFRKRVFPVLTPLAVDPTHPFPQLKGLGLNLLVEIRERNNTKYSTAVIHIPSSLPRFIQIPTQGEKYDFVLLEDLIRKYAGTLFPDMKLGKMSEFRITRNADLDLSEAEADDLLKLIERELRKRRLGTLIRLEVSREMSKTSRKNLLKITGLSKEDVYDIPTFLDLSAFMYLLKVQVKELKDTPFSPTLNERFLRGKGVFESLQEGDVLLHHPYDSFSHVEDFVMEAAKDPQVLAIKQTLYRTNGDSPIVEALKIAVENGKQVTALIELKARFDEQNNIEWAKELDRSGVNVVYGVLGLKTHCKICMVLRQESNEIQRYLHLSTGNYNSNTAKIYTDLSLMTCDEEMGEDASELFNLLTGYSRQRSWRKFLVAPATLREDIMEAIRQCRLRHTPSTPARIMMAMNSLVDPGIIQALYEASQAGVKVDLVIRGICCLRPGIKGVSEHIRVKSIVGRFLEHTRIFSFETGEQHNIFIGSADLMQRNLNRRVELVFPLVEENSKQQCYSILKALWNDQSTSRFLCPDGSYTAPARTGYHVQKGLIDLADERKKLVDTIG